jgi:hypothetical protein
MSPCGVDILPRRAAESFFIKEKRKAIIRK